MQSTITYTEDQLVKGLKSKDRNVFSYLYDNYSAVLYGAITRMVSETETANDILQEAFVKIWENLDKYDASKGRLFTWMLNVTRNYTIDVIRSKGYKKQQLIRSDENIVDNQEYKTTSPLDKLDRQALANQIRQLDQNQQKVIHLAYFMGYTQEEISNELDIPLGTVKSRIRAALIELRKTVNINNWI